MSSLSISLLSCINISFEKEAPLTKKNYFPGTRASRQESISSLADSRLRDNHCVFYRVVVTLSQVGFGFGVDDEMCIDDELVAAVSGEACE